ncbi:MAG: CBS domain-containing protein [Rhodocyclaceae bacterium]|nr:CBS domain-containing protein [Rhodocyclaceae bacterium]
MSICGVVKDHYTCLADYPHVRTSATLGDVFAAIAGNREAADQFRNVLVLDPADRLIGVLGLHDMLHAVLPDYLKTETPSRYEGADANVASLAPLWQDDCESHCRKMASAPVGDDLTLIDAEVRLDDPLTTAIYLFATHSYNLLPVVEEGRVIGVLRLVDVVTAVTKAVLHE